jgi:hypothetical protein
MAEQKVLTTQQKIVQLFTQMWEFTFGCDVPVSSWEYLVEAHDPADLLNALNETVEAVKRSRKRRTAAVVFERKLVQQREASLKQWLADEEEYASAMKATI